MIIGFVGTPGSGKSYEAVKKIIDNLKSGRFVCTNIDGMDDPKSQQYIKDQLNLTDSQFNERFRYLTKDETYNFFGTESVQLGEFGTTERKICPAGCLIVIDEAHKFFNSRDWQSTTNRQFSDWASTHRHEGYDLVLVTQDIEKIDKQCRSLIEWTYFFRKINFLGSAVKNKYICYSYTGDDHNGKPLAKNTRTYDPAIFPAYSSYTTKDAKEVGFMSHVNILKHPVFFAIPVILGFCLWMISKSSIASGDLFGSKKKLNSAPVQSQVVTPAPASVVTGLQPQPVQPVQSSLQPQQVAYSPAPPVVRPRPISWEEIETPKPKKEKKDSPPPVRHLYVWHDENNNIVISNVKKEIPDGVTYREEIYNN